MSKVDLLLKKPIKDKGVNMSHYPDFVKGYFHQADLLFLPTDKGYRYALVVVDVGTRKCDARPLKSKTAVDVLSGFESIYNGDILTYPTNVIGVDSGTDFNNNDVYAYFEALDVEVKTAKPARHRQQSIVERLNREIGKYIMHRQTEIEVETGVQNTEWTSYLPYVIKIINGKRLKTFKPKKDLAIPNKVFAVGDARKPLDQGTKVRAILDAPRDYLTKKRLIGAFREGDIRWDPKERTVMKTLIVPGQTIQYLLDLPDGTPDYSTTYTKSQLQVIPESQLEPKPVEEERYEVERLLSRQKVGNKIFFSVKWVGYDEPTLEPRSVLIKDIKEMVLDYERNH